ncbi:MAG: OmpA family protein [Egibacteraceae bacterium]
MNAPRRSLLIALSALLVTTLVGTGAWAQPERLERLERRIVPLVRRVVELQPRVTQPSSQPDGAQAQEPDSAAPGDDGPEQAATAVPPPGDEGPAEQTDERTPPPVSPSPARRVTVPSDVLFDVNSDELATSAKRYLERLARDLAGEDVQRIVVTGHTDSSGPAPFNLSLSRRRAASVRDHLLSRAVLEDVLIQARGVGEGEPVANDQSGDPAAARRNRRVTITYTRR